MGDLSNIVPILGPSELLNEVLCDHCKKLGY